MSVNGGMTVSLRPLTDFGARLGRWEGREASAKIDDSLIIGDGRRGSLPARLDSAQPPTAGRLRLELTAADPAALLLAIDRLKAHLLEGRHELVFDNRPTRFHTARFLSVTPEYFGPGDGAFDCTVVCEMSLEPVAQAVTAATYALSSTPVALPVGTSWSDLSIVVHGAGAGVTDVDVVLCDFRGVVIYQLPLRGSLTSVERWVIDSLLGRIVKVNGSTGVVTDALAAWDRTIGAATNEIPVLRPVDANTDLAAWPTLALVALGTGTPVGTVTYREAYQ